MAAQTSPEVTPQKEDNLSTVIVVGGKKMYANLSTVIVVACAGHSQLWRPQPFGCRSPGEHMQNVPSEETFTTPDATASSNRWTVTETADLRFASAGLPARNRSISTVRHVLFACLPSRAIMLRNVLEV